MSPRILTLDEIQGQPVGGKAEGLARLRAMGLRVPEAVVLVGASPGGGAAELAPLLAPLFEADEGVEAEEAALGAGALAVRSSALGEDGEDVSFAGQYETVLGVRGLDALIEAIGFCLDSAGSDRAVAYRDARDGAGEGEDAADETVMSVVIQRLVDARASGVCFTADPVTSRRNRLVIDSVAGLGEALVSGHASPDHDELQRLQRCWEPTQLAGDAPCLAPGEREQIAREAIEAEAQSGAPLDLEWAIDSKGTLYWLQARPITTLSLDPQSLDIHSTIEGDVYTRCNVGEMMPGAVSPLTYSTCARGIDIGWQNIKAAVGVPRSTAPPSTFSPISASASPSTPAASNSSESCYLGMSHGHLFINLSEGARFSSAVTGASPDQQSLAICGRLVPEVVAPPPPSLWIRLPRILRQVSTVLRPKSRLRRMEALLARGGVEPGATSLETWQRIDARRDDLNEAYELHLVVSSGAGALAPILLGRLAEGAEPTDGHHAIVAELLAGAEGVESADIAEGAERILDALWQASDRSQDFVALEVDAAIAWLESKAAGPAGPLWTAYLFRHGHRSLRELDIRQPEWEHDPTPLIRSLQTQLRGRLAQASAESAPGSSERVASNSLCSPARAPSPEADRFKRIRGLAHAAVRNRERGKSLLVGLTAHHKRAYRALAAQLVEEGRLPDVDAVYFLFHEELGELVREAPGARGSQTSQAREQSHESHEIQESPWTPGNAWKKWSDLALARREALAYQETLSFPEVAVGLPQPEVVELPNGDEERIVGKPVSRGRVEGRVRVVRTLEEAEALEPGEILVAPITDVGWTPYFAIIAGLVTDVGSAVSHGAVVAREYGLPAVLNTRTGTSVLQTGERVLLDGDRGIVERLDHGGMSEAKIAVEG